MQLILTSTIALYAATVASGATCIASQSILVDAQALFDNVDPSDQVCSTTTAKGILRTLTLPISVTLKTGKTGSDVTSFINSYLGQVGSSNNENKLLFAVPFTSDFTFRDIAAANNCNVAAIQSCKYTCALGQMFVDGEVTAMPICNDGGTGDYAVRAGGSSRVDSFTATAGSTDFTTYDSFILAALVTGSPTTSSPSGSPVSSPSTDSPTTASPTTASPTSTDSPSSSGASGAPSSSGASDAPSASGASDAPSASGASDAPSASGASDAPSASGASDAPSASGASDAPSASGATDAPATTTAPSSGTVAPTSRATVCGASVAMVVATLLVVLV